MLRDLGLLVVRGVAGGIITGHGGQKLFGWFQGPGIEGTAQFMESLGLQPAKPWATLAGGSEFVGGLLTTLGFLHPIGPIMKIAPMLTAIRKTHWSTPIWAEEGGAELPLTYISISVALATTDPGRLSLDYLFGIKVPRAVTLVVLAGVVAGLILTEARTAENGEVSESAAS